MLRVKGSKIICLILSMIIACSYLCVPSVADYIMKNYPGYEDIVGVSVAPEYDTGTYKANLKYSDIELKRGDTFKVYIESPVMNRDLNGIHMRVDFDPSVLKVIQWDEKDQYIDDGFYQVVYNSSNTEGFFAVASAATGYGVDVFHVDDRMVFVATFRVLSNARLSETELTLTNYSLVYDPVNYWADSPEELANHYGTQTKARIHIYDTPDMNAIHGGGISATPDTVYNNELVTVKVEVPQIAWNAQNAYLYIEYDPTEFDVEEWAPGIGTSYIDSTNGRLWLQFSDNAPELDEELHLTAILRAKKDAVEKDCPFTLVQDIKYNGVPLWVPDCSSVNVHVTGYPRFSGGIYAPGEAQRGTSVDVTVEIPGMAKLVDNMAVTVQFDPTVFEVEKWEPVIDGMIVVPSVSNTAGNFGFTATRSGNLLDFPKGIAFKATLRVKDNAKLDDTVLTLSKASVMIDDLGVLHEGWTPDSKTAVVTIYDPFQVEGGGISLSKDKATSGEKFEVIIDIPKIYATSDTFSLAVSYDPSSFELLSSDTGVAGVSVSAVSGYLTFTATNPKIDLSAGLKLRAYMQVLLDAPGGESWFRLSEPNVKLNGVTLWKPIDYNAVINVTVTKLPVEGGGISAPGSVKPSDSIDVTVTVPAVLASADTIVLGFTYDADTFDVMKWSPSIGGVSISGSQIQDSPGYFRLSMSGLDPKADLSSGLKFVVTVRAKSDAVTGRTHEFELKDHLITFKKNNGTTQEVWIPTELKANVKIVSEYEKYPVTDGGIKLSSPLITAGSSVTATVTVPKINVVAEKASFTVAIEKDGYVKDDFILSSLSASVTGFISETGTGTYTFTGTNIDLSKGITFTALANSRSTASGTYTFRISTYSFISEESGSVSAWAPATVADYVTVSSGVSPYVVTGGGISLSKSSVSRNGTFNAYIKIPAIYATATTMSLMVEFDRNAFEVTSWNPPIAGAYSVSGAGYFMLDLTGANYDLSKGLTLTAKMKALKAAATGNYSFDLTSYQINGYPNGSASVQNLWLPSDRTKSIRITSGSDYPDDPTPNPNYGITGGGISVSSLYVRQGELFTVYVTVPAVDAFATSGGITVQYDANAFDLVTWAPNVYGGAAVNGVGSFGLSVSGYSSIDLSRGLTLYATLRAKNVAVNNRYLFSLYSSLVYGGDQIWYPAITYAYVTITDGSGYNWTNPTPWHTDTTDHYNRPDNGDNNNNNNNNNNDNNNPGSQTIEPDDGDEKIITPGRKVNITLKTDLKRINSGRVSARTNAGFFSGDTIIYVRNTAEADSCADTALRTLRLSNHRSYAFDISLYNTETGKYVHYLPGGYIDFYFPIPDDLSPDSGDIAVYHTQDGVPELIDSVIVTDDGVRKIHFRATSFSPYMFVDLVNLRQSDVQLTDNSVKPGNNGGGDAYIYDEPRNSNPRTGLAGWLIVPAGATVCVLLARKDKKRKRSTRK